MGVLASDGTPTSFEIKPVLRAHFPTNDQVSVLFRILPHKVETRKARRADMIIERIYHVSKNPEGVILFQIKIIGHSVGTRKMICANSQ
jgi:hypothetical protein